MRRLILQRRRYFVAVEGESEQSFVAWIQILAEGKNLAIHLDTVVLGGGGFNSMLRKAISERKRRAFSRGAYEGCFLIVDEDRSEKGDWPVKKLRSKTAEHKMIACVQKPNHEGLLYRLNAGCEDDFVRSGSAVSKLKKHWPNYEKPVNAQILQNKYSLDDLLRAAKTDRDLAGFLRAIGLVSK